MGGAAADFGPLWILSPFGLASNSPEVIREHDPYPKKLAPASRKLLKPRGISSSPSAFARRGQDEYLVAMSRIVVRTKPMPSYNLG